MNDTIGISNDYTASSINIKEDKIFRGVVEAISPKKITKENKELLDAFIELLIEESPISINITDIFNKDKSIGSLDVIQKQFAQTYLNNFYEVWNKAKSDYRLKNKLENLLLKYKSAGIEVGRKESFLSFFENEEEMYTSDRYMMAKTFNEKKGTELALEYAYKLAWLADVEGPLRDAYFFNIHSESCLGLSEGFLICGSDLNDPDPTEPSQNIKDMFPNIWPLPIKNPILCSDSLASRIGSFTIADAYSNSSCAKFTYQVEGSLYPEFFEAFVLPLAHPIGFGYIYRKVTSLLFEDYFNLEVIYRCDEIGVRSLCTNGDCSVPSTISYAERAKYENNKMISSGGGKSQSQLKYIEKGIMVRGEYKDWDFEKYTFDNSNYLIQYTYAPPLGKVRQVIEYYDIVQNMRSNLVKNSSFDTWYDWNIQLNGNWSVGNGFAKFDGKSTLGEEEKYKLTQSISLKKDKKYKIVVKIDELDVGESVIFRINERKIYDDNGNFTIEHDQWILSENIEYSLGYAGYGGEKIQIFTEDANTSFKLEYVNIYNNNPTDVYTNDKDQSDIYIVNLDDPKLNLFTYDEMTVETVTTFNEDMNQLYYNHLSDDDKYPLIGMNIIINEYSMGRADVYITGFDQIIDIKKDMTVDYLVPTNGLGKIRTRYEAVKDLGDINLFTEDFTDINKWNILFNNIDTKLEADSGIINEGAFRIGSKTSNPFGLVIPRGSDNTTYMLDELEINRDFEAEWIPALNDISFSNPSKWFMDSDWRIEEFSDSSINFAEIKPRNAIITTGNSQIINVQIGTLIEYINDVSGPNIDNTPPFGHRYFVYESLENRGDIDINEEDFISSIKWKKYTRTVDAHLEREIDGNTILDNEIIKIRALVEFQQDYNDVDNWIELNIGQLGDYTYRYNVNLDYWVDVSIDDLITFQHYKNGDLISEKQYKSSKNRGTINLKDEDYMNLINWVEMSDVDNVPKYTYKFHDNNMTINLSVGTSIDKIYNEEFGNRVRERYISKTNRNNINLNWEDFKDESLWTFEKVNDPIRITNSRFIEWGGFYKPGDKIYFTASRTFRGQVKYFNVNMFNKNI